jgi:hypothetical protein
VEKRWIQGGRKVEAVWKQGVIICGRVFLQLRLRSKGKDRKKHDRRKSNKYVHCYIRNKNGSKVAEKWKKGGGVLM